jgi:hypothetical protein
MTDELPIGIVEDRPGELTIEVPGEERQIELLYVAPTQRPAPEPAPALPAELPGQTALA